MTANAALLSRNLNDLSIILTMSLSAFYRIHRNNHAMYRSTERYQYCNERRIPMSQLLIDLSHVDWHLLRRQKRSLVKLIGTQKAQCTEDLQGLLHLVDYLQDEAAEKIGERAVFGELEE
jgi:hypothetical protein